jgi:aryl-alcohol dehydrogenase-like predicted oxidoreductase
MEGAMAGAIDRRTWLRLTALGLAGCGRGSRSAGPRDDAPPPSPAPSAPAPTPPVASAPASAPSTPEATSMLTRPIPRSGEALPVIGLGTWQTFDVGDSYKERAPLIEVMRRFLAAGGRVIDSSPMYGNAEQVTGDLVAAVAPAAPPFLATKVWTSGKQAGADQMKRSMRRLRAARLDLMQIHNLLDWRTHLPVLREWKQAGTFRYLGVTHYQLDQLPTIEKLMRAEALDFVQVPYSIATRAVEKRLLPAALDTGTAVLTMTPFESGELFARVEGKALPPWAAELGIASWAQYFLKFILGHPAVNAPLPATARPHHLEDNVAAGRGRLPDEAERARMIAYLGL